MRKLALSVVFLLTTVVVNAQELKVLTTVSEAGDVASFELDCSKKFPTLAKGLRYNITRHEFKGVEKKNTFRILFVMDGFFTTVLNSKMTFSAVFVDGTITSEEETVESDGYFDGACTLLLKSPPELGLKTDLKEIVLHAGNKKVVYAITAQKAREFRKNLQNIVDAK